MANKNLKPYELSVWEYTKSNSDEPLRERKIAVIGTNESSGLNDAFNIVFRPNVNGEKTLTFSIHYRYFDVFQDKYVVNPFSDYLFNERKVKLKFDGKWYDFIIRDHQESSDGLTWNYTATDAFILELSKNGYNVELDTELNNNQGTVIELGKKVIANTDWKVDEENSDNIVQNLEEPLYTVVVPKSKSFQAKNVDTNEIVTIGEEETLYFFYSYIINRETHFVQFIRANDNFQYDDDNVITAPNYRIENDVEYIENEGLVTKIKVAENVELPVGAIYLEHHGYRKVYKQITQYDPVSEQVVDLYGVDYDDGTTQEIYHYLDYDYVTSQVVTSYIANGDNFNIYDDGSMQGWESGDTSSTTNLQSIELDTRPTISPKNKLPKISSYAQIEGFLRLKFNNVLSRNDNSLNYYKNTFYNDGFQKNLNLIQNIVQGQEYVLRLRCGYSNTADGEIKAINLASDSSHQICALVAAYTEEQKTFDGDTRYVKCIDPSQIILDFHSSYTEDNNYIRSGRFNEDKTQYIIDSIPQEPSSKYCYQEAGDTNVYVWNSTANKYVVKNSSYRNYYYMTASAERSISNTTLTSPETKIGLFLYLNTNSNYNHYYFIDEIQLTKAVYDNDNQLVTIGNIPTSKVIVTDCFYLKTKETATKEDLEIYHSAAELAKHLGSSEDKIYPIYNEDCLKVLSVNESHSNCFNLLQTLAETFECWVEIYVEHDDNGAITIRNNEPVKLIRFKNYAGKENFAGFKYDINLSSIERTINSDEIVTKLIVDPIQSDYTDKGIVTIQYADANPSKESYLLNFDYYVNKGLITDADQCVADLTQFYKDLHIKNKEIQDLSEDQINLENALLKVKYKRNVFVDLIAEAKNAFNKAKDKFEKIVGVKYDTFVNGEQPIPEYRLTKDETVKPGKIYYSRNNTTDCPQYTRVTNPSGNPRKLNYYENNTEDADHIESEILQQDDVVATVGEIYQNATLINNYSGIADNLNVEYKKLYEECYGTDSYSITASVNDEETTITVSEYLPGLVFKALRGSTVIETCVCDVNRKVFHIPNVCDKLTITNILEGYKIQVTVHGETVDYTTFPCTFDLSNPCLKYFKLVPIEEKKGITDELKEKQSQKDAIELEFFKKYGQFVQEGTWSSQDYIDSNLYYLDALQVSHNSAQPKVSYNISVAEVSEQPGLEGYDFTVGDKTYIEDTEFFGWDTAGRPVREEIIVSEVEWHLDNPVDNTITVQNYKTRFEDLFQRLSATVQTVQYNEATYAKTTSILNQDGTINQNLLLSSLNGISGREYNLTSDGTIITNGEGILVRDLTNAQLLVKIGNGGIKISNTGGETWSTAIDGNGIDAGLIHTGVLNTKQIFIQDGDAPSFRWDSAGISAYRSTQDNGYDLQTFVRFDQNGLYGIKNAGVYKLYSLDEIKQKAHFGITWDGFFIKNSYTNGYVSITSDNDFQVMQNVFNTETQTDRWVERIKIGALEWGKDTQGNPILSPDIEGADNDPSLYGIRIQNQFGDTVFKTGDDGNLTITGILNALGGNFSNLVTVGKNTENNPYIAIDGTDASIRSSNYQDGAGYGWMINKDGDAVFNNITARGAIKTAVFEYAEIQAVGGVFLFRPSSTIRSARINGDDLIVKVEKPALFAKTSTQEYSWCKISNYTTDGSEPNVQDILLTNGLTHVYQISNVDLSTAEVTLAGAAASNGFIDAIKGVYDDSEEEVLASLEGGALIDMGREDGSSNYGIGVNSSDNTVNLPRRAISLFETVIDETKEPKVSYKYRGILGTLPELSNTDVRTSIYKNLKGEQGIFTDNIYIGDNDQYLAFYTDKDDGNRRKLKISAREMIFSYDPETETEITWEDKINQSSAITVKITSNTGNVFLNHTGQATLTCTVYRGEIDITNTINDFTWIKADKDGVIDTQWTKHTTTNTLSIDVLDIDKKAVFTCEVELDNGEEGEGQEEEQQG